MSAPRGLARSAAAVAGTAVAALLLAAAAPAPPALPFTDVTGAAGVGFVPVNGAYGEKLLPETMGGGVALFDFDDDGDADLLLVGSASWPWRPAPHSPPPPPVALYANDGHGRFTDVTRSSGLADAVPAGFYGMGVAVGDADGDGWRDVFLTAVGHNLLLRNRAGRFADATAAAGVAGAADAWSTGAAFFDADGDRDLDLVVVNYVTWSPAIDRALERHRGAAGLTYGLPQSYRGTLPYLYRNRGDGTFDEVAAAAGLTGTAEAPLLGKGMTVLPLDADADGRTDLLVANDTERNFYFHNLGGGRFAEEGEAAGLAYDADGGVTGAMGADAGWLAGDGRLAVLTGNFSREPSSAYRAADGGGAFSDEALRLGLAVTRRVVTFGVLLADLDLDGRLDLVQSNGHVEPAAADLGAGETYRQPTQLFWNSGERLIELPAAAVGDLARPLAGRGSACADLDGDGDLDLVLTQVGARPAVLRNDQATGHHWLRVVLRGRPPDRDALGARLELTAGGALQRRRVETTRSYLSQSEPTVTFGLGAARAVDRLEVVWPDGTRQRVPSAGRAVDRLWVVARDADPPGAPAPG